jgi:hypothetical protein
MTFPYGQTVTLIKRSVNGTDGYGNDTYGETTVKVSPCVIQPSGSTEDIQWTDEVATDLTVFMPYGTDVDAVDAVDINGVRYEVQGDVSSWVSPFSGKTSPIQMRVRKVTGASV